jgi:hypothetical protein
VRDYGEPLLIISVRISEKFLHPRPDTMGSWNYTLRAAFERDVAFIADRMIVTFAACRMSLIEFLLLADFDRVCFWFDQPPIPWLIIVDQMPMFHIIRL